MTDPTRDEVEALEQRLRGQDSIPSRTEVADAVRALRERAEAAEQCAKLAEACLIDATAAVAAAWEAGRDAAVIKLNDDPTGKTAVRAEEYPRWFADRYNDAAALACPDDLSAALNARLDAEWNAAIEAAAAIANAPVWPREIRALRRAARTEGEA